MITLLLLSAALASHASDTDDVTKEKIIAALEAECRRGDVAACGWAGKVLDDQDHPDARAFLEPACDAGYRYPCDRLLSLLLKGADPRVLGVQLKGRCANGDGRACNMLKSIDGDGRPELEDFDLVLGRVCAQGHPEVCLWAGIGLQDDGRFEQARAAFQIATESGSVQAKAQLGRLLLDGQGGPADPRRGAMLLDAACRNGALEACLVTGRLWAEGGIIPEDTYASWTASHYGCLFDDPPSCARVKAFAASHGALDDPHTAEALCDSGVAGACAQIAKEAMSADRQDPARAAPLYLRACEAGYSSACTWAGSQYQHAQGVEADPVEARRLYRSGCDGGHAEGCTLLGTLLELGLGGPPEPAEAARMYRKGCEDGHAWGCTLLGGLYADGVGVPRDPAKMARYLRAGCDGGHALGCTNLGMQYEHGKGLAEDATEAARLYRLGCEGGNAEGCTWLATSYREGRGVPKDLSEMVRLYRAGCEGGHAIGCINLGVQYEQGNGVAEDAAEAVRLFLQGCDGGNAEGCIYAGTMYGRGSGVPKDLSEMIRLFRAGCEGGYAVGCTNLGVQYEHGNGVAVDAAEAARLYRLGCEGGNAVGCTWLATSYRDGRGVPKNPSEMIRLFRAGCEGGHAVGCTNLGVQYEHGNGVAADATEAARLYRLGCEGGSAVGCTNLGLLVEFENGTPQDVPEAARLYGKGCDGGNPAGCVALANLLMEGKGVTQDMDRAVALYRKACMEDQTSGCAGLGIAAYMGRGLPKDLDKAAAYFEQGCAGGEERDCGHLAYVASQERFDFPAALDAVRRRVALQPEDPGVALDLVEALFLSGHDEEARVALAAIDPAHMDGDRPLFAALLELCLGGDWATHAGRALAAYRAHGEGESIGLGLAGMRRALKDRGRGASGLGRLVEALMVPRTSASAAEVEAIVAAGPG